MVIVVAANIMTNPVTMTNTNLWFIKCLLFHILFNTINSYYQFLKKVISEIYNPTIYSRKSEYVIWYYYNFDILGYYQSESLRNKDKKIESF